MTSSQERSVGLAGATGIGVGAIVGGGILALAGIAFAAAGPAALLAFVFNGLLALITALSFAEMSTAFPESGGTYAFAKKTLSVQAAFAVGWVVWLASILAAVLYALGFAVFALEALKGIGLEVPLGARPATVILALLATAIYTWGGTRGGAGGGQGATVAKMVVFAVLLGGGFWALTQSNGQHIAAGLTPFFTGGLTGLLQAMGFTFIAFQGFDLISAVAGEVIDPVRTIPRAMLSSLGIALAVYIPLLFLITTVGLAPGQSVATLAAENADTLVPHAVERFMGRPGYWFVVLAGVLSMLSALQANLLAASHVALAMARDRTLPGALAGTNAVGAPVHATLATAMTVGLVVVVIPGVAEAGAAASLIFLLSFALTHWMCLLRRWRAVGGGDEFRVPWFPALPAIGTMACVGLALFQGATVPSAGAIVGVWMALGAALYLSWFERRAVVVDAAAEAFDPDLLRLRGRNPIVLVPIANPDNAEAMVAVATALSPPQVGRALLLTVVKPPQEGWSRDTFSPELKAAQEVLGQALNASFSSGLSPEALTTVSSEPWSEIQRVCGTLRCEVLLLGLSELSQLKTKAHLEHLLEAVDANVVVLRAQPDWSLEKVERVLVPVAGQGGHAPLRARFLSSLWRQGVKRVTYFRFLSMDATEEETERWKKFLRGLAGDELPGTAEVQVIRTESIGDGLEALAQESDLLVMGLQPQSGSGRAFSGVVLEAAARTPGAIVLIRRR